MVKYPYFGAAYYPEAWPREQIDTDLALLQSYGMNTVRIAEFAWGIMEPEEGKYDFSLFREVVDKCATKGIGVIMGTPSATLPSWMEYKYPDVFAVVDGRRLSHGGRRLSCPNNQLLREKIRAIVRAMAQEFGNDDNIIGWQIDNEISPVNPDCSCDLCVKKYHTWLKNKYGTIQKLNETWGNYTFSLAYSNFEEIPYPANNVWNNATHKLSWIEYKNDTYAEFIREQADILHEYVRVPVGTDMMLTQNLDVSKVNLPLDVCQVNHYVGPDAVGYWMALYRGIHPRKFWVTETSASYNGSNIPNGPRQPGFCRANTLKAFANGAEANLYWPFRCHYTGHEIAHGSVVDTWGRETPAASELRQLGIDIPKLQGMIEGTTYHSHGLAVVCSHLSSYMRSLQSLSSHITDLGEKVFDFLEDSHFNPDVITSYADLTPYRLIISASQYTLDEDGFAEKMIAWVRNGGTWVVGPLTDVLTAEAIRYRNAPFGHLEDWADIRRDYVIPAPHADDRYTKTMPVGQLTDIQLEDGTILHTEAVDYDAITPGVSARTLGKYMNGDLHLNGRCAITETQVGKGRIIVLGAQLDSVSYSMFIEKVAETCNIHPITEGSPNVHVTWLEGSYGHVFTAIEGCGNIGRIQVPINGIDILTGQRYTANERIDMEPYQCLFVKGQ